MPLYSGTLRQLGEKVILENVLLRFTKRLPPFLNITNEERLNTDLRGRNDIV